VSYDEPGEAFSRCWRAAEAFDLAGTSNTGGAPSFAHFAKGGNRKCPHDPTNTYRIAISTIVFEFLLPAIVSRYQLRTEVTPEIGAELVKTHKSILSCHPERSRMIREASRSVESKDPYFSPRSPVESAFDSHK